MGELVFIGMGLYDERDISLRGIEEIKTADTVFAELYTSLMPKLSIENLEKMIGKKVVIVSRRALEDENGKQILREATKGKIVMLVPGDPLIATTHIDLRIRAEKEGIRTRVVHGASIISAVIGLSGLHNYKFGRSVTIPFHAKGKVSETPYKVITQNRGNTLHTLCFLDINAEERRYMTVKEGLETLLEVENIKRMGAITPETLVVGVARAGAHDAIAKAGYLKRILSYDFGSPPHSIIFPCKLHFMEVEALITLAGAPENLREEAMK